MTGQCIFVRKDSHQFELFPILLCRQVFCSVPYLSFVLGDEQFIPAIVDGFGIMGRDMYRRVPIESVAL